MTTSPDAFFAAHTDADGRYTPHHRCAVAAREWRGHKFMSDAIQRDPQPGERPPSEPRAKPTAVGLGVDLASLDWQRSGTGAGSFEVAFVAGHNPRAVAWQVPGAASGRESDSEGPVIEWVLLRVAGDPAGRVLVYDRNEWLCFLDGAARGEFDLADRSPIDLAAAGA